MPTHATSAADRRRRRCSFTTAAPARIELHRGTGSAVRRYLGRRRDGPLLLSERRGREPDRLTRFGLDYLVKQVAQAAGLEQSVSGNTLRRRYVIAADANGTDLDQIRDSAGHADRRTTRRYLESRRSRPGLATRMTATPSPLQAILDEIDLSASNTTPATLTAVTDLAIEIAREGREGRKIGTLFTVGAETQVLQHSRCLILDPLAGHPMQHRQIEDPDIRETIKELAQLDGGFIISGTGVALSACRYFESTLPHRAQPLGLGTRHIAAASISAATRAVAIVVSESSIVRLYAAGTLVNEILPELWLLQRYMPHIAEATLTTDRAHNLGIVSERPEHASLRSTAIRSPG